MANILFGGPQEKERGKPSPIHDDLVARLKQEGHEVNYVVRGDEMMRGLTATKNPMNPVEYDLVLYDTGLFYYKAELRKRIESFKDYVIDYLNLAQAPVIVLADEEIAEKIRRLIQNVGFKQINKPYKIDDVVRAVDHSLSGEPFFSSSASLV
ncbi:MAG: hypothetical protein KKF74_01305 [Nanoarchaeota archaeon]|nr:hypothetical protein [Nanoarchaeota archaeon]